MKFAFIDLEYTGVHANTTMVSIAIVGTGKEQLCISFTDYDRRQVTPWLAENVLVYIQESKSLSYQQGFNQIKKWLEDYSERQPVSLISAGKLLDMVLLFQLWHHDRPDLEYFHFMHGLPDYLNHGAHFDLQTIFFLAGIDPNINREDFIQHKVQGKRHEALYDALVVRECFWKCVTTENFPKLEHLLRSRFAN